MSDAPVYREITTEGAVPVVPDPGPAPMLQWLALESLVIDDRYQRPLGSGNWRVIHRIAKNFQWSRFSPVLVAPIEGGRFAIIDGQHRAHAAAICGIPQVPAMVVPVDLAEQARAFSWVSSQAIRVSGFHIYKAALAAGEDWALRADAAVSAGGGRLMQFAASTASKKPGEVYCIGLIGRLIGLGRDGAITRGLAAMRAYDTTGCAALYTDYILAPWFAAVHEHPLAPDAAILGALMIRDPFKVVDAANAEQGSRATVAAAMFGAMIRAAAQKVAA